MVLDKRPVPGHHAYLDYSRERASAVDAGGGCLNICPVIYHFSSFSLSLGDDPI